MPERPQRPFVPHRTPSESREPAAASEFRIAPPFVHKGARGNREAQPASISDFLVVEETASIADFLAPETSFETTSPVAESYELPPIEHFTESAEDQGMYTAEGIAAQFADPFAAGDPAAEPDSFGWEETDWQRYDWRSAAALGETTDPEASSAWAQTDWGIAGAPQPKDPRESAARAIADALDGIARRIREGDLALPSAPGGVPDPATIAATLAALLGVKR